MLASAPSLFQRQSVGDTVRGGESSTDMDGSTLRILWVDDRPRDIGGLAQDPRVRNCVVDVVETASVATEALRKREHDFMILDWKLLNGTGAPVLEMLPICQGDEDCQLDQICKDGYFDFFTGLPVEVCAYRLK